PAGRFQLSVDAAGYARLDPRQSGNSGAAPQVTVADGQQVTAVTLAMSRAGVLSGVVTTPAGLPLARVAVMLHRWHDLPATGGRALVMTASTETNDLGAYRFENVLPGE